MNILSTFQDITATGVMPAKESTGQTRTEQGIKQPEYKPDVLDIFSEKVVNKKDLNDMVTTPRAIFKGYLCFTVGTTVNTIGSLIKQGKAANMLKIAGCLASIYGTYNFVKPYLIKNETK